MNVIKRVTSAVLVAASLFSVATPTIATEDFDAYESDRILYEEAAPEAADDAVTLIGDEALVLPEAEALEAVAETPDEPSADTPAEAYEAQAPDEEIPAEEIPAEEIPAEEIPAEETPAEETPADEVPGEEEPEAETVYTDWAQELRVSYDRNDSRLAELTDRVYRAYGDGYAIAEDAESTVSLSGWMPVGTSAAARAAVFESADASGETPVMVLEVALRDENGEEYGSESPVTVEIRSDAVTRALESGAGLYAYLVNEPDALVRHELDRWSDHITLTLEALPAAVVITGRTEETEEAAVSVEEERTEEEAAGAESVDPEAAEPESAEPAGDDPVSPIMLASSGLSVSAPSLAGGRAGILLPVYRHASGEYLSVYLSGLAPSIPGLNPAAPDARPGMTVIEAWAAAPVDDGASLTLQLTAIKLPALETGERLAVFSIKDDAIGAPVLTDLTTDSVVSVQLAGGVVGTALVKLAAEPVEQTVEASVGNTELTLTGTMPAGAAAAVEAAATPAELASADSSISLDITIGDGYQPEEPITVAVSDPAIRDMLAAGMEIVVAHIAEDGTPEPVEVLSVGGDTVVFQAEHFSVFTIGGYLVKSLFSWTTDQFNMAILGLSSMTASYAETTVEAEEGLTPLSAYSVSRGGLFSGLQKLWINVMTKIDLALSGRESIAVYSVKNGVLGDLLEEDVTADAVHIELGSADGFAVVKDTGFRHLSFDLNAVTLDGMMPKNANVEAADATGSESVQALDAGEVLAAYDIAISENGADYQPDAEHPIEVEIESDAITAENANDIELWHIADDGTAEKIEELVIESGKVRFRADSFSVYVIVEHEGGEQKVSRRVYHFIDPDYSTEASDVYSAAPYMFPNKAASYAKTGDTAIDSTKTYYVYDSTSSDYQAVATPTEAELGSYYEKVTGMQCSQILLDGETLELVRNPADKVTQVGGEEVVQHFYGWYLVQVVSDSSDPLTGTGTIRYRWGNDPQKIEFGTAVAFTDAEKATHADYHYYLAPIYVNYHFVNFHEIPKEVEDREIAAAAAGNTYTPKFIARKMVALGDDDAASVLVSDVMASPTDNIHFLFRGWEVYIDGVKMGLVSSGAVEGTSILVTDQNGVGQTMGDYIMTIDANAAQITNPLYFITLVGKHDVDLYPVFNEIRWVYFNVGKTGNGASYVPSKLILTDDEANGYNTIDTGELTLPTRPGYEFDGWYAGDIVLDGDGTFDTDGKTLVATYNTSTNKFEFNSAFTGTYNAEPHAVAGLWYKDSGATSLETGLHVAKAYNDDPDNTTAGSVPNPGKRLTLYAHWTKVDKAPYKVVIWKQSVNDAAGIPDDQKTYDYETFYLSDPFSTSDGLVIGTTAFKGTEKGEGTSSSVNLTGLNYKGFTYSRNDWTAGRTIEPDGSTVINVYYDRITYNLRLFFARRALSGGTPSGNYDVPYMTGGFNSPAGDNQQTWQDYVAATGNGMNWGTVNTDNFDLIYSPAAPQDRVGYVDNDAGTYRYWYYIITDNYGADISGLWPKYEYFPDVGNNNYKLSGWWLMRGADIWQGVGQNDTVKGVIPTMDEKILGNEYSANGNFLLASYRNPSNHRVYDWTYTIYFETLAGVDYTGKTTVERVDNDGVRRIYYLANSFTARSSQNTIGQQNAPSYTGFEDGEKVDGGYPSALFYYTRKTSTLTFDDNFPDGIAGGGVQEKTVAYDASLAQYGKDVDGNYIIKPTATPDHYVFGGWYEDATCTVPFRFGTSKMPAANKVVYAKWTEVTYSVEIDANAGTINHMNPSEVLWTVYKKLTDPADIEAARADGTLYTYTYRENSVDKTLNYRIRSYNVTFDGTTYSYSYAFPQPNFDDSRKDSYNSAFATYVNLSYDEILGQYDIKRSYVPITAAEAAERTAAGSEVYYYVNMLRVDGAGTMGIASDTRNAFFLRANDGETELKTYFRFFANSYHWTIIAYGDGYADAIDWMETDANNDGKADAFTRWNYNTQAKFDAWLGDYSDPNSNISKLYAQWLEDYNVKDQYYRPMAADEEYQLLNWYVVDAEDKSKIGQIFDFNSAPNGRVKIQAEWRLNGRYHLEYEAKGAAALGGSAVDAAVAHWRDPDVLDRKTNDYADNTDTIVREQPRFLNDTDDGRYIFRGWYIAGSKKVGDAYVIDPTVAMEGTDGEGKPLKFYDVGDDLTVQSLFANNDGVIFLQAYFETYDGSVRRPYVTNLTLDANKTYGDGYITTGVTNGLGNKIEMTADTQLAWTGAGTAMAYAAEDQIKFGDVQSSANVHLYRYATYKTFDGVTGTNYFAGKKNYVLLGFDPVQNPANIVTVDKLTGASTGTAQPYIPNYAADAVIGVTRNENITLYAIWEPMLYATFVNETGADIEVTLDAGASLVNKVTGEFDRESTSGTVTVPAGELVKVVFPTKQEGDEIIASAPSSHRGYKLTVGGRFDTTDPYGTGMDGVKFGKTATYTGKLQFDADGIVVTYTEVFDPAVTFDVNGGNWVGGAAGHTYTQDGTGLYTDDAPDTPRPYKPEDPARSGYVFLGWTTNEDIKDHTDFSGTSAVTWGETTITPEAGSNVLAKIKSDYLWDFTQDPPYGQTLYAVWSAPVTVTFNVQGRNGDITRYLHKWNGGPDTYTATGSYAYSVTIARGDKVNKPTDPTHYNNVNYAFLAWTTSTSYYYTTTNPVDVTDVWNFASPVDSDLTLYTSWTAASSLPVTITKTVVDPLSAGDAFDFTYTIKTYYYVEGSGTLTRHEVSSAQVDSGFTLAGGESTTINLHYWTASSGGRYNFYYQTLEVTEADVSDVYSLIFGATSNGTVQVDSRTFTVDVFTGKMAYTSSGGRGYFRYNESFYYRVDNNRWYNSSGSNTSFPITSAETTYINTRKTAQITVKKLVTGTGADNTKEFSFTAALSYNGHAVAYGDFTGSEAEQTFTLHDNGRYSDEKVLTVPIGAKLTLTETGADEYKTTVNDEGLGGSLNTGTRTYDLTVTKDGVITFTNKLDLPSVTGLEQNLGPNTLLFGVTGLTLMTMALPPVLARRKRRKEDESWEPYEPYPPLVPADGPSTPEEAAPVEDAKEDETVRETVAAFTLECPAAAPEINPVSQWYTVRVMRYCGKPRAEQDNTWYTVRVMGRRPAHWGGERT